MKQRIISGMIIAAAVVGLGVIGSYPLYLILMLLSVIGYAELTNILCSPSPEGARSDHPGLGEGAADSRTGSRRSGLSRSGPARSSSVRSGADRRSSARSVADRRQRPAEEPSEKSERRKESREGAASGFGRRKAEKGGFSDSAKAGRGLFPDLIAFPGILITILYYAGLMYIEWRYGLVNSSGMISAADFWMVMAVVFDFLLTMGIYVYSYPKRNSRQATGAVAAFLYVPVLMSFVCRTRNLRHGIVLYLLIFICSSVSDVCALAAGMTFGKGGKHRLAPDLSPKKTIEGAVGGVLGSAAASCIVALILRRLDPSSGMLPVFLIIGICGSIVGQTGDLAASAIKRNHHIKDYGNLIPGHGGIMDRFDSVLFTAPLIYYLSFLLMDRF